MSRFGRTTALLAAGLFVFWGLCPCALSRALRETIGGSEATATAPDCPCCAGREEPSTEPCPGPGCPQRPGDDCPKCLAAGCGKALTAGDGPVSLPEAAALTFLADAATCVACADPGTVSRLDVSHGRSAHGAAGPPGLVVDTVVLLI